MSVAQIQIRFWVNRNAFFQQSQRSLMSFTISNQGSDPATLLKAGYLRLNLHRYLIKLLVLLLFFAFLIFIFMLKATNKTSVLHMIVSNSLRKTTCFAPVCHTNICSFKYLQYSYVQLHTLLRVLLFFCFF